MAFNKILEAINSHPDYGTIKGIKGLWQEGPMSDNLNTFNEKYFTEHWSEADAAKETFTGKMAKSAGYTEVEKVVIGSKDKNGKPTMVTTYFIKPQK